MPRALAIETSGRVGSVAAVRDGQVIEELDFPHGLQHAAGILPLIDHLCAARGWKPADLEELYVSIGPGSFTGLRIGVTLAKTLAFATGLRIVPVPSVRVLVENAPPEARHALIVLDAKRDQIFTALFERTPGGWEERQPAQLASLPHMLELAPRPLYLIGEGIPHHQKFIPPAPNIIVTPPQTWSARAATVARVGLALATSGHYADPLTLTPIYIRLPEAEEKWLRDHPGAEPR